MLKSIQLLVSLILVSTIGTCALPAFADDIQTLNFHFVVPTSGKTHILSRQGTLKLEFRNTPFSKMKETLQRCLDANVLPAFDKKSPLLYIYLPNQEMYEQHKHELAAEAQRQFEEIYPGVKLDIKFRVVRTNINVRFVYNKVKHVLNNLKQRFAGDHETQAYIQTLDDANESAFQQASRVEVTAPIARKVKFTMASARFFMVAATRSMQSLPIIANGGAPATAAMSLIVVDAATEFFTVAYTQTIQRLLAKWPLSSTRSALWSQASQIINNSMWNFVLFSVGRPTLMQTIAHVSNEKVPAPTIDSVGEVAGVSAIGVGFYSAFTHGYNSLRDKGWISASQIDIVLQITGLFDLATTMINSNPNWYPYRIFTVGPQWLFYAAVGALGRLAPNRADKILAVETSVLDWQDVHGEHTADTSWHIVNDKDFNDALEYHRKTTKVIKCAEALAVDNLK